MRPAAAPADARPAPPERTPVSSGGDLIAAPPTDIVDRWGMESFPASDPPANW